MIRVIGERGTGRTIEIMRISEQRQIPILCTSAVHMKAIKENAKEFGIDIPEPIMFNKDNPVPDNFRDYQTVLVDNIEDVAYDIIATYGFRMIGASMCSMECTDELHNLDKADKSNSWASVCKKNGWKV